MNKNIYFTSLKIKVFLILVTLTVNAYAGNTNNDNENSKEVERISKELTDPNNSLAQLKFEFKYQAYNGSITNADNQSDLLINFKPSMPIKLGSSQNKKKLLFIRPQLPFYFKKPNLTNTGWDDDSQNLKFQGIGDMSIDLSYGNTNTETGLVMLGGILAILPTASEDNLGLNRWAIGPEFLIGKLYEKSFAGVFVSNSFDLGSNGSFNNDSSKPTYQPANYLTVQPVFNKNMGRGLSISSAPKIIYNYEQEQWNIPIHAKINQTIIFNKRPIVLGIELEYFIEKSEQFGPDWAITFTITPIVKNSLAEIFTK